MLRINAHTTWRVREIVRRWRPDLGVAPRDSVAVLDEMDVDDVELLAVRIFRWLVKPSRLLPIGRTLAQVASTGLEEYVDHADTAMGAVEATAADCGVRYALWRAAAHAGLACRTWWGTPGWPRLVASFMTVIDDPEHEHWHVEGHGSLRPVEPMEVSDRAELRQMLLRRPWDLDTDIADCLVRAGIGYLDRPIPPLPSSR